MKTNRAGSWEDRVVSPEEVLSKLEPGMSLFISTGVAGFFYKMLIRLAKELGIKWLTADVLASNKPIFFL